MYTAALKQHNHKAFRRLNPTRLRVNPPLGKGGSKGVHAFSAECLCIKNLNLVDPACGTAGFLVSAAEYIRRHYEDTMTQEQWDAFSHETFTGFDTDRTMLRISAMNLMLHSISNPEIDYKDSVSKQNEISAKYSALLANARELYGLTRKAA